MNKVLKGLLAAVLAVSAAQVQADNSTNKTFLMPRPDGVDLPMEYTTFQELINRKDEDKFGASFQVTGFYRGSTNDDELAKYFLINNKDTITLARANAATTVSTVTNDLDLGYIIHKTNGAAADPSATIHLDPEHTAWGVRIDYDQDLSKLLKGLYLKVSLPIVSVENDLGLSVNSTDANLKADLQSFFQGQFTGRPDATPSTNAQAKLTKAKIAGDQDETGVADIDVTIGYKFLNKENYFAAIALAFTIPTGNDAEGEFLFEPIVGNGQHFGLGGDLMAQARVWGDMDHNLKINLWMKYRYLFESDETRTLGIKGRNWGQYTLLVPANAAGPAVTLVPAANVTTVNVEVTPGSQFDGILALAYNNGGFCFDLGYNMYFREEESVKLDQSFTAGAFAIAARNLNTTNIATPTPNPIVTGIDNVTDGGAAAGTAAILSTNTLDTGAAETPSQFTHSIYAGLGYIFKEWDTPLMLGLGSKYEWASKNSAIEQWSIWGKIGVGF